MDASTWAVVVPIIATAAGASLTYPTFLLFYRNFGMTTADVDISTPEVAAYTLSLLAYALSAFAAAAIGGLLAWQLRRLDWMSEALSRPRNQVALLGITTLLPGAGLFILEFSGHLWTLVPSSALVGTSVGMVALLAPFRRLPRRLTAKVRLLCASLVLLVVWALLITPHWIDASEYGFALGHGLPAPVSNALVTLPVPVETALVIPRDPSSDPLGLCDLPGEAHLVGRSDTVAWLSIRTEDLAENAPSVVVPVPDDAYATMTTGDASTSSPGTICRDHP